MTPRSRRSSVVPRTVIAGLLLLLGMTAGDASADPVTIEDGRFLPVIPMLSTNLQLGGQGFLPLGNDPNSPGGFGSVNTKVTVSANTPSDPNNPPSADRFLTLLPGDPLAKDPNAPDFQIEIVNGQILRVEDIIFFPQVTITFEDIDPNRNFAGGLGASFNLVTPMFTHGDGLCEANTAQLNFGCDGPMAYTMFPIGFDIPLGVDINGNGSLDKMVLGLPPGPGNPSPISGFPFPFFTVRGNTTFTSPNHWDYEFSDPNNVIPGSVNPPFTIGGVTGSLDTVHAPVFVAAPPPAVPAPQALSLLGVGVAGLGLFLRFRTLRRKVNDRT